MSEIFGGLFFGRAYLFIYLFIFFFFWGGGAYYRNFTVFSMTNLFMALFSFCSIFKMSGCFDNGRWPNAHCLLIGD